MSMFSMTSSSETARLAAVCSNGERFTQTRAIVSGPCSLSVPTCSALSRTASTPAAIFGLIVFTRPSSISGKPVKSSIARVSTPASFRCFAVPPVETISTPSSRRQRANSAMPVLSETVISARLTRTSARAVTSTSETVRTSLIDDHPTRIGGIHAHLPPGYETYSSWQQLVLYLVDKLLHNGDVPRIGKVEGLLKDDRPAVDAFVDEMDRNSGNFDPVFQRLLDHVDPLEGRQQGRMDVDDLVRKATDEARPEDLHPAGEHHQLGPLPVDPIRQRGVAGLPNIVVVGLRKDLGRDAC